VVGRSSVEHTGECDGKNCGLPRSLTSTLGAQAPPCRYGDSAFLNNCATQQRYDLRKYLLRGPGTVQQARAEPSGVNGVGRHMRSLSIPLWGVSRSSIGPEWRAGDLHRACWGRGTAWRGSGLATES
jgi:hypothetical protein